MIPPAHPGDGSPGGRGRHRFSVEWPYLLVGAVFMTLHLGFQIFALLQSYLAGMSHFDEPLSRQAAEEARFWENATTVATFPLGRIWEHLPLPWRNDSVVEWVLLAGNSFLWAGALVLAIRWVGGFFSGEEEG